MRIVIAIVMLVAASACDRNKERNSPEHFMNMTTKALTAKGLTVEPFKQVSTYPGSTDRREQVQCASVSRNENDSRICVVVYDDTEVTIRAAGLKFHESLPVGSRHFVAGKLIFVVEPGRRPSDSLIEEILDETVKADKEDR